MPKGWIRAWAEETARIMAGDLPTGKARSRFRKSFTTPLRKEADESSEILATLTFDDKLELPNGIESGTWTQVKAKDHEGFVAVDI